MNNTTEIVAWIGAITGSIALLWDIFKWSRKGANIKVSAKPNMRNVNYVEKKLDDKNLVVVDVINVGDLPTTITHLFVARYVFPFSKLLNKPSNQGVIARQSSGNNLPIILKPGENWMGIINQADIAEKIGKNRPNILRHSSHIKEITCSFKN